MSKDLTAIAIETLVEEIIPMLDTIEDNVNSATRPQGKLCLTHAMWLLLTRRLISMGWVPDELLIDFLAAAKDQNQYEMLLESPKGVCH